MEYCSAVWSPQYVKHKALLEKVQHRFSRMFPELKSLPYEQRLDKLGLWTLEERHNRADLLEVFKLIKGFTAVSWTRFFTRIDNDTTRGHNWKLMKKHCCDLLETSKRQIKIRYKETLLQPESGQRVEQPSSRSCECPSTYKYK